MSVYNVVESADGQPGDFLVPIFHRSGESGSKRSFIVFPGVIFPYGAEESGGYICFDRNADGGARFYSSETIVHLGSPSN